MKKLITLLSLAVIAGNVSATLVIDDNFDTGIGDWTTHWQGGLPAGSYDATGGIGGSGSMNLATNRLGASGAMNTIGFSGGAGQDITISARLQISTIGPNTTGGNVIPFKMMVSDTSQPWNNVGTGGGIFFWNNNAVGLKQADGQVGNWSTRSTIGLDNTAANPSTSDWFTSELVLTDNAGTYDMTINLYDGSGTLWASQTDATSIAVGTTLYTGFTSDWASFTGADMGVGEYAVDNFQVDVVPEPATLGLIAMFGGGVLFIRRRFML